MPPGCPAAGSWSASRAGLRKSRKRAVRDAAEHAGAKEVHLVAEPMAAAIGVGLDVEAPVGNMIVDIGGGTTEIAVIALSGIVNEESIRVAGDEMNSAIIQFFKKNQTSSSASVPPRPSSAKWARHAIARGGQHPCQGA